MTPKETVDVIVKLCSDKKATNIRYFEMSDRSVSDYVIIASVNNTIHAQSLLQDVEEKLEKMPPQNSPEIHHPPKLSGKANSGWMILDLNAVIVHVMTESIRTEYDIDTLFSERNTVHHF